MTNDQAPMPNSRERKLSVEPATECDKWVWRSSFFAFCQREFSRRRG